MYTKRCKVILTRNCGRPSAVILIAENPSFETPPKINKQCGLKMAGHLLLKLIFTFLMDIT